MVKKSFKVTNENGIHARPATTLVNEAMRYDSDITLTALKKTIDLKSIMGVMSLGIYTGVTIEIKASGHDDEEAIEGLKNKIVELGLAREI